ncbi:MAG: hypothetical protein LBR79_02980 [Oscillospiraceae bacterium]|nr:hypothetical protein [Oscillospiraceae bacterium]
MIISFPPAYGGGKRRDFYYFGTRPFALCEIHGQVYYNLVTKLNYRDINIYHIKR